MDGEVPSVPDNETRESVDLAKVGYLPIWGMLVMVWCCLVIQWKRYKKKHRELYEEKNTYTLLTDTMHNAPGTGTVGAGTARRQASVMGTNGGIPTGTGTIGTRSNRSVALSSSCNPAHSMTEASGGVIPKNWQRGQLLGSGSFGSVYMGIRPNGTIFAVKVINLQRDDMGEDRLKDLEREVNLMASLDHPNIVRYLGVSLENGEMCIFMEYIQGGSLGSLVRRHGQRMGERAVVNYCRQTVEGVFYLHENDIIHRDLKGDNILLGVDGCKLADFGTSKQMHGAQTEKNAVNGTPLWMSPEAIKQSDAITLKADIWSLGCVICELLNAGKPPWPVKFESTWQAMYTIGNWEKPLPPNIPSGLSKSLMDLLKRCFNPNQKKRASIAHVRAHPWLATRWEQDSNDDIGMGSTKVTLNDLIQASAKQSQGEISFANPLSRQTQPQPQQGVSPTSRKAPIPLPNPASPSNKHGAAGGLLLQAASGSAVSKKPTLDHVGLAIPRINSVASLHDPSGASSPHARHASEPRAVLPGSGMCEL